MRVSPRESYDKLWEPMLDIETDHNYRQTPRYDIAKNKTVLQTHTEVDRGSFLDSIR